MPGTYTFMCIVVACIMCGCMSNDASEATHFLVYDRNAQTDRYELIASTIETFDDVRRGQGQLANLRGGGNLIPGPDTQPRTEQSVLDALRIEKDSDVDIEFNVDAGLVIPWDFDSAMMLTLYHHLEKAAFYFDSIDVPVSVVGRLPVYYFPTLTIAGVSVRSLFADNAAYAFTLDAFIIPPRLVLQDVPLSANRGVIVHEYSHAVFNRIVHQNRRAPRYLLEPWPVRTVNELTSLDEGVADIFAALATGEPNFLSASVSEELFEIDRNLETNRFYNQLLFDYVRTMDPNEAGAPYNPYHLGSVIASAVWALRPLIDDADLARAVIRGLEAIADPGPDFRVTDFMNHLVTHLPAAIQPAACSLFADRLLMVQSELQCSR